jgi:hypothetical protein
MEERHPSSVRGRGAADNPTNRFETISATRRMEPRTSHPRERLEAMAEVSSRGVPCAVLVSPVVPGLKVLDGRAANGHFWVFYGALSNVEYTVLVRDTVTGAVRTYQNPPGQLASRADTEAF